MNSKWLKFWLGMVFFGALCPSAWPYDLKTRASRVHMHEAQEAYAQGNTAGAVDYYQKAIDLAPGNVQAINGLAEVEEQLGALAKAKDHWQKVIALDPKFFSAYTRLGFLSLKQQDFAVAAQYLQQCIVQAGFQHPEAVKAQQGLDEIARRSGYYRDQMVHAQAQKLDGQLGGRKAQALATQVDLGKAMLEEGRDLFRQGHYQEAMQSLDIVLKFVPGHPEAMKLRQAAALALRKATNDALMDETIKMLTHH